ncbi:hypothetical protein F4779DRAFT_627118 [Xylariaceae sp. FL0662B]|nr:hypothetical protein F4779DRAFT_627118 [Xylariaceae sp. FL0662B]
MSQPRSGAPYSTLEVSSQDPEFHQKEVVAYPDHSYPQAVPLEQQRNPTSYFSPDSGKEAIPNSNNAYAAAAPAPVPVYQDPNYAGGVAGVAAGGAVGGAAAGGVAYYNDATYPNGATYPPSSTSYSNSVGGYPNNAGHPGAASYAPTASPIESTAYGASPLSAHDNEGGSHYASDEKPPEPTRVCGLSKKTFWIIMVIAIIVVIGAVAGGIAGGLAGRKYNSTAAASGSPESDGSPKDPASSTPEDQNLVLGNSRLTASNWTDSKGVTHRTVLFQDVYNAIIARRWDSNGKKWATDNLTDMMHATTTPLRPIPGTPLASASMDKDPKYETHLWFLDPDNIIRSMTASDALNNPSHWTNDTLDDAVLETWPGGQLAATWQRCWGHDCDGWWIVAYQRPEGAIKTANSSIWGTATVAVESSDVAANSSIGIIPDLRGPWLDRLNLVSESVNSDKTGTMRMVPYEDTWTNAGQKATTLLSDIPLPSASQQFAVTKWNNWNQALYLALLQGGELQGSYWNGRQMNTISSFEFNGGPSGVNFTAIAMSSDAMLYGISGNKVLEYSLDTADPSKFNYVSTVFP